MTLLRLASQTWVTIHYSLAPEGKVLIYKGKQVYSNGVLSLKVGCGDFMKYQGLYNIIHLKTV